jgi:hypothetical protein
VSVGAGREPCTPTASDSTRRLAIPVQQCLWADLPDTIDERFDVVLCTGNALAHSAGQDAMVQALAGLRRMARPGGMW